MVGWGSGHPALPLRGGPRSRVTQSLVLPNRWASWSPSGVGPTLLLPCRSITLPAGPVVHVTAALTAPGPKSHRVWDPLPL